MDTVIRIATRKVSEVVFPDIKISYRKNISLKAEEVISNLPLQMCLFYNVTYFPVYILIHYGCLIYKFPNLTQLYKILLVFISVLLTMVEISRLYLGYIGNLTEKVPELAGFWMLTLFLQFPLLCLCMFTPDLEVMPWERMSDVILLLFLIVEIIVGYFAVKAITSHQALKFKLQLSKSKRENASTEISIDE